MTYHELTAEDMAAALPARPGWYDAAVTRAALTTTPKALQLTVEFDIGSGHTAGFRRPVAVDERKAAPFDATQGLRLLIALMVISGMDTLPPDLEAADYAVGELSGLRVAVLVERGKRMSDPDNAVWRIRRVEECR